jgi:hypothetical protein
VNSSSTAGVSEGCASEGAAKLARTAAHSQALALLRIGGLMAASMQEVPGNFRQKNLTQRSQLSDWRML